MFIDFLRSSIDFQWTRGCLQLSAVICCYLRLSAVICGCVRLCAHIYIYIYIYICWACCCGCLRIFIDLFNDVHCFPSYFIDRHRMFCDVQCSSLTPNGFSLIVKGCALIHYGFPRVSMECSLIPYGVSLISHGTFIDFLRSFIDFQWNSLIVCGFH